jgi:hypothetical protein
MAARTDVEASMSEAGSVTTSDDDEPVTDVASEAADKMGDASPPTPASPSATKQKAESAGGVGVKAPAKKVAKKASKRGVSPKKSNAPKRQRRTPLFPASTFEDALELAIAIYEVGAGQQVRRITLFDHLGHSPDSGRSRQWVTNSAKYGLTTGSYSAEFLQLTADGLQAVADDVSASMRIRARFKLAVEEIPVFKTLYETYLGNRLPTQAVLADKAKEFGVPDEDLAECVETFTVNTKYVGVLRTISGAERLLSIDAVIDDFAQPAHEMRLPTNARTAGLSLGSQPATGEFDTACFYITPIGTDGTEQRKHSDLFMGSLVEPALSEFGLRLVRADQIGEPGMITGQIIEHIIHSKLVIVDLSFHNPNVFYELALRHAVRKPIVQISRTADRLPFDVGQFRTIMVDTTDIYSLVPQLESLKAEIAAQIRKTLDEKAGVENPLSIFAPTFWDNMPFPKP